MRIGGLGTLIRHTFWVTAATIPLLPVAMVQPPLGALLMTAIGGAMLTDPRLGPARLAAIALSPVATGADRERRPTVQITTMSQLKWNFPMNRHRPARAAFDKDNGSWHGKTTPLWPSDMKVIQPDPVASNNGVHLSAPRKLQHRFPLRPLGGPRFITMIDG